MLSHVQLLVTPWTKALQVPLLMEFSENWSGLPFPSLEHLLDPGIKPGFLAFAEKIFTVWASRDEVQRSAYMEYVHQKHLKTSERLATKIVVKSNRHAKSLDGKAGAFGGHKDFTLIHIFWGIWKAHVHAQSRVHAQKPLRRACAFTSGWSLRNSEDKKWRINWISRSFLPSFPQWHWFWQSPMHGNTSLQNQQSSREVPAYY